MKVQGWMFVGCAVFFLVSDIVYWFWSHDATGSTALGVSVLMAGMIGYYTLFTVRRIELQSGEMPEDRDAEISEGAGEIGFFSPHSWWPLFTAASVAFMLLGFVFGWGLFFVGIAMTLLSAIGFVFEYYRGHFAH